MAATLRRAISSAHRAPSFRSMSGLAKPNTENEVALLRFLEANGIPSNEAKGVLGELKSSLEPLITNAEIEKFKCNMESKFADFKSEVQLRQASHSKSVKQYEENIRCKIEKMSNDLRSEIEKVTIAHVNEDQFLKDIDVLKQKVMKLKADLNELAAEIAKFKKKIQRCAFVIGLSIGGFAVTFLRQ